MVIKLILSLVTVLYPIDKPTQRMLIESSDLIVRAKINKTEINNDTTGCIAYLKIVDQILSNHKNDLEIKVGYNCLDICDWPADFKSDKIALIFLKRLEQKKYYINGLSYGISYPEEHEYNEVKKRVNDYLGCKDDRSKIDWIVDGLENEYFIEDTKHELRFYHEQVKRERKSEHFLNIYESIDDAQYKNIQSSISKHFEGIDLSIDLLNYFYKGNQEIKKVIIKSIKYYRDSEHKHMTHKYINILNSYQASSEQLEIEKQLSYKMIKNKKDEDVMDLINKYLDTIE